MDWDIYGNDLRPGYCEVHPYVHQEYPCHICRMEDEASKVLNNDEKALILQMSNKFKPQLESRIKGANNDKMMSEEKRKESLELFNHQKAVLELLIFKIQNGHL